MIASLAFTILTSLIFSLQTEEFSKSRFQNWHHWRGPNADGVAPEGNPPVQWSESKNIEWKVAIPGSGASTPIVWDGKVFLLTAVDTKKKGAETAPARPQARGRRFGGRSRMSTGAPSTIYAFDVICLDLKTGKTLWTKTAVEVKPHEGHHPSHGFASASPTTDGEHLYVSFGSRGLFCYDLEGVLKWKKNFGNMTV